MRGIRVVLAIIVLAITLSGCMGRKTVVVRGDPEFSKTVGSGLVAVRECKSTQMKIRVLLAPPVQSAEEIWTRRDVRVEMAVSGVEQYGIFSPLVVIWDHRLNDGDTRTFFDDFPNLEKGTSVQDGRVEFSKKYYVQSLRRFLLQIKANQSLTHEALVDVLSLYGTLIDSCTIF